MATVTPMMAQYLEIKKDHQDALLFYRMGDFYEMFFEDAVAASEALDIALTKRGKHEGADIPMCGVPVHSAEGYFLNLIRKGFRVAVCEQMESPAEARKRGSKSVVKREVVRLVTPGTLTEDALLEARSHNFLAAFARVRDQFALAWADISTGEFHVMSVSEIRIGPELARLAPSELILAEETDDTIPELARDLGIQTTPLGRSVFDSSNAEKQVCSLFRVTSLDAFGSFNRAEISAMGALISYLELTQKGRLPLLNPPRKEQEERIVQIDAATRRNLELTRSLTGTRAGSLLSVVDRTVTPGGARLLEQRLSNPSRVLDVIHIRCDAVAFFLADHSLRSDVRDLLRSASDLERALSRLSLDRGGPRDIAAIRNGLGQAGLVAQRIHGSEFPSLIGDAINGCLGFDDLTGELSRALVDDPPLLVRDGGFIAPGFDPDLDEARKLRDEGRSVIASLQRKYSELSGVVSLKIKHNNVLGYFIETTAIHSEKMLSAPLSETFIHRQTTANQVRFTTVELSELETRILNSGNHALEIEKRLFEELKSDILDRAEPISRASRSLSEIDLAAGLADLAQQENWCRPVVSSDRGLSIIGGRHPVVERALGQSGEPFIPNDCDLQSETSAAIWLLTGPNMAGKSTFLRQNALIVLLAQAGCYVPAERAEIGLVSQIFSRVGASDDLARGRSTFMVEMVETAAILNQADDRALVILDEIGRGTSTYDGLSIAWATLEHLHEINKSRALFATHYHELTALAGKLDGVDNATVAVKEWQGEIIFLHEIRKGAADRSYGVQVAQLAGLPDAVVARARTVLNTLEKGERERESSPASLIDDLPLFSVPQPAPREIRKPPAIDLLESVHPDELTPREALNLLYELKEAAKS